MSPRSPHGGQRADSPHRAHAPAHRHRRRSRLRGAPAGRPRFVPARPPAGCCWRLPGPGPRGSAWPASLCPRFRRSPLCPRAGLDGRRGAAQDHWSARPWGWPSLPRNRLGGALRSPRARPFYRDGSGGGPRSRGGVARPGRGPRGKARNLSSADTPRNGAAGKMAVLPFHAPFCMCA